MCSSLIYIYSCRLRLSYILFSPAPCVVSVLRNLIIRLVEIIQRHLKSWHAHVYIFLAFNSLKKVGIMKNILFRTICINFSCVRTLQEKELLYACQSIGKTCFFQILDLSLAEQWMGSLYSFFHKTRPSNERKKKDTDETRPPRTRHYKNLRQFTSARVATVNSKSQSSLVSSSLLRAPRVSLVVASRRQSDIAIKIQRNKSAVTHRETRVEGREERIGVAEKDGKLAQVAAFYI